jgi:hypothetical protein
MGCRLAAFLSKATFAMTRQLRAENEPFVLLACLLLSLAGCSGNDGPTRYDVSGSVTLDGKPIPVGEMLFAPDTSKGNSGPGSVAKIKNGRFETTPGRGIVGGPYRVVITGFDGKRPTRGNADTHPLGNVLVKAHTLKIDLPKQNGSVDINVPKSVSVSE